MEELGERELAQDPNMEKVMAQIYELESKGYGINGINEAKVGGSGRNVDDEGEGNDRDLVSNNDGDDNEMIEVSPQSSLSEGPSQGNFEEDMIFSGEGYNVNFYGNLRLQYRRGQVFGDGVAREEVYGVHFNNANWANVRLTDVLDDFFELLNAIVERLTRSYEGHDLVRIYISNRAFNVPVTAGLIPLRDFDVASILQRLEEILQSETDLVLEEGLEMHIAVIRLPRGEEWS